MRKVTIAVLLSVLGALTCAAQNVGEAVAERMAAQQELYPQEKVYVQTDKHAYLSGERIWLRAHLVDASDGRPSQLSRYVYVELINPFDALVRRILLRPDSGGVFAGFLDLAEDLPEGNYTLRAYTRYMRNGGEDSFFRKTVVVLDPFSLNFDATAEFSFSNRNANVSFTFSSEPELASLRLSGGKELPMKISGGGTVLRLPSGLQGKAVLLSLKVSGRKYQKFLRVPYPPQDYDVSFLPEGGYLVPGRACRVGVKATGADGLGVDVEGKVVDSKGNEVASFGGLHHGMGSFLIKPAAGEQYTAICSGRGGEARRFPLPVADARARVLQLQKAGGNLMVSLLRGPESEDGDLSLMVYHGTGILYCGQFGNASFVSFKLRDLPSGVTGFALLDPDLNILSERLFFNINESDMAGVGARPGKDSYKDRELVRVGLKLPPGVGGASLGVSVIDADAAIPESNVSIFSEFLLSSELKGYIESPAEYFTPEGLPYADALMLTQGWRRYSLPEVLRGNPEKPALRPEKFRQITGHAEGFAFSSMEGGRVSLYAVVDSLTTVDSAPLNKDGRFVCATEFPDGVQVTVQTQTKKGKKWNIIELDKEEFPSLAASAIPVNPAVYGADLYMKQADEEYIRKHGIRATMLDAATVSADYEEKPSESIWYSPLNSTQPLTSKEIEKLNYTDIMSVFYNTPGLAVRHGSGGTYLSTTRSELPVLPVVDDVVLPEYDVMSMSAGDIDNLFVVKDYTSVFGYYPGYEGALVITTTVGNAGDRTKSFNIGQMRPLGYQKPEEFWSPKYETPEQRESPVPDLRTTIYWNPSVNFDASGECVVEFWTADKSAEYQLVGEGVGRDGRILEIRRSITIKTE